VSRPLGNATNDAAAPLSDAAHARRQRVLAIQARSGGKYAVLADSPDDDPVIMALATPDGTCDLAVPRDKYDAFELLAMVVRWNAEPDPDLDTKWWRVSIQDPDGRTVEVDAPSGSTLTDWEAYAARHHGPGAP
jgi:hypothetical protein